MAEPQVVVDLVRALAEKVLPNGTFEEREKLVSQLYANFEKTLSEDNAKTR